MLIRTYADIEKLDGEDALSDAERLLIENCKIGELTALGSGTRPDGPSPERTIRAELLRYLILGGCEQCRMHEKGVRLAGAWIAGELDLSFASCNGAVYLSRCAFAEPLAAHQASFDHLVLNGSSLPGMNAQNSTIKGDAFLDCLKSASEISFSGAEIGGQLYAECAELSGGSGSALNAQRSKIRGGVFLRQLMGTGEVSISGAEIGGQLLCQKANLKGGSGYALNAQGARIYGGVFLQDLSAAGEVTLSGATIGGQLAFDRSIFDGLGRRALNLQRVAVRDGLYWREVKSVAGPIDLSSAHIGDLAYDENSWDLATELSLVGLTYENFFGSVDLKFHKRLLKKGASPVGQFHPQPYQQLAKFYREGGHRYEAREILIEKEREQRKAAKTGILVRVWDAAAEAVAGYGYKPWLSLWWLAGLVAIMIGMAQLTWNAGDFAPNSAVVLTSQDWKAIADGPSENPAADWTDALAPGKDYETFYSFAYALDVVVPVLDLGQTDAWAPSPARGDWGYWVFYLQKIFIVLGWVVTAIAAAAISGMIRRDD